MIGSSSDKNVIDTVRYFFHLEEVLKDYFEEKTYLIIIKTPIYTSTHII